ncbi:MAG: rod shape-determining protein MreD [Anaerolineales bacterium]
MAILLGIPALALLAILQSTVFGTLRVLDGAPDLILLAVVGWALTGRARQAMALGLVGGVFLDLLSGTPIGTSAIGLILVAYLVSLSEGRFWEAHFLMPLAAVLGASLVYHTAGLVVLVLLGRTLDWAYALTRVVLPSTFLNLLLALPVAQAAESLEVTLYPPEVGI